MTVNNISGPGATGFNDSNSTEHLTATVHPGESTLSDVAHRVGVEVSALHRANPQISHRDQGLHLGQELRLPQGASTGPAAPDPTTIADVKTPSRTDTPTESVSLNYGEIKWSYKQAAESTPAPLDDPTTKAVFQGQLSATEPQIKQADGPAVSESISGAVSQTIKTLGDALANAARKQ